MRALLSVSLLAVPLVIANPPKAAHLDTECPATGRSTAGDVECRKLRISTCAAAAESLGYFGPGRTRFVESCAPKKQMSEP